MTKLCPRGKAAAKRKFKVYPSAYANAYASKICAGKIKDPSGVKRKDFRGPKPSKAMGGRIYKANGGSMAFEGRKFRDKQLRDKQRIDRRRAAEKNPNPRNKQLRKGKYGPGMKGGGMMQKKSESVMDRLKKKNAEAMKKLKEKREAFESKGGYRSGGMTMMPRAMYKKGGKSFPDLSGDGKVTMKDVLMGRGVIPRKGKKGGGLMEATSRLRAQGLKAGGVAKGCGAVMNDRRKVTKVY